MKDEKDKKEKNAFIRSYRYNRVLVFVWFIVKSLSVTFTYNPNYKGGFSEYLKLCFGRVA